MLVTVLLPGMHLSDDESSSLKEELAAVALPSLSCWLRRGESEGVKTSLQARLRQVMGFSHHDLPLAAALATSMGIESASSGYWLCVSPIRLQASQNGVYMQGHAGLNLQQEEVEALINSLNIFLQNDGIRVFLGPTPYEWLMRVPGEHHILTTSLGDAMGKNLRSVLPQGESVGLLEALLSEIQMLFHQHPVNLARRKEGLPTIEGLWAYGAGHYPKVVAWPWDYAMSASPGLCALAQVAAKPCQAIGPVSGLLSQAQAGSALIYDDRLERALIAGDSKAWLQGLKALEVEWFKPLHAALKRGQLEAVEIEAGEGRNLFIQRRDLIKFWRKRQALVSWLCN